MENRRKLALALAAIFIINVLIIYLVQRNAGPDVSAYETVGFRLSSVLRNG